jgi:hypothetical protein
LAAGIAVLLTGLAPQTSSQTLYGSLVGNVRDASEAARYLKDL